MSEFFSLIDKVVTEVSNFVWGIPMLIFLVGAGFFLTIRLKGLQFSKLFYSLKLIFVKQDEEEAGKGDISNFQALMTALSATVGTGNIAGVATAIATGGPGALFWMWVTGLVGMATKYAEAVLAVKYREEGESGQMQGGPMYYISKGLGWKWLGILFAIFAAIAAFGIGNMAQSNSVAQAVESTFGIASWITGVVLVVFSVFVILGGIKSIGRVTAILVPVMIVFYSGFALFILFANITEIPNLIAIVFKHAFTPTAATGGFLGSTVMLAMRMGVARGVFSNESGLGSAPIAAATARTKHPVHQALISMTQTFIDTLVVCSMTGFIIILSGLWQSGETGAALTAAAFSWGTKGGNVVVTIGLILFAYSTILGWCYYGEKSIEYLFGEKSVVPYRIVFIVLIFVGTVAKLDFVWSLSDAFNGLMAIPNLIALVMLSPVVVLETKDYFSKLKLSQKGKK
ncbi:MAG: alanine/glycine:cation symporter family protein [bacterium]